MPFSSHGPIQPNKLTRHCVISSTCRCLLFVNLLVFIVCCLRAREDGKWLTFRFSGWRCGLVSTRNYCRHLTSLIEKNVSWFFSDFERNPIFMWEDYAVHNQISPRQSRGKTQIENVLTKQNSYISTAFTVFRLRWIMPLISLCSRNCPAWRQNTVPNPEMLWNFFQ